MRTERFALALCLVSVGACAGETFSLGRGQQGLSDAGQPEASAPDAAGTDASANKNDAGELPFGAPVPIDILSSADSKDDDPSLTSDLTLLLFNSQREGGAGREDIWLSTRSAPGAPWLPPTPVSELNTEDRETGIAMSSDGLHIWFSSNRDGGAGGLDVYTAERSDRDAPFVGLTRVEALCTPGDDLISAVDDTLTTVYFARRDDDDDDYDLFASRRADAQAAWGAATPLASLNSDQEESDAFAVQGGTRLIFTRDGDLVVADRSTLDGIFGTARALDTLNSERDDRDAWASDDFRTLLFSSNRSGSYLLYEARR